MNIWMEKAVRKELRKSMALVVRYLNNGFKNTRPLVKVHLLKQDITHHILLNLSKQLLMLIYPTKGFSRIWL